MNAYISEAFKAFEKAKDTIETAEHDMKGGYILAAINRAYYSMFYCMTALLLTKEVHAKTHSGTKAKFRELYIKSEILPTSLSQYVEEAFNARQRADYDMDAAITEEAALTIIANAKTLYETTKNYLIPFTEE